MPGKRTDKRTEELLLALGEHLRRTRDALGVPQVELARVIDMEPTNLAKIERGAKNVTIDTLVRIAEGLGVELVVRLRRSNKQAGRKSNP